MDRITERFIKDCRVGGMTDRSRDSYLTCIKVYQAYLENHEKDFLTASKEDLRDFIEYLKLERELSVATVKRYLAAISSLYEYMVSDNLVPVNIVSSIRARYIRQYKDNNDNHTRKLISKEDMARMINSEMDIRDKAILTLLAKTGIRRNELITLDLSDVDFVEQRIRFKSTAKRTNRTVFFDEEAAFILRRWLRIREGRNLKGNPALFLNAEGDRLERRGVYDAVQKAAERVSLHDPSSQIMEDRFSPHCCRHWFTTHLRRAGMPREFIQVLRGDVRREAIDIYDHIDLKELKESYLAHIPQLGI